MKMITWEEVTPELKKLDKHRKIGLIFSFVAAGIFAFPTAFGDSELNPFQKILYSIGTTLVIRLVFGAIVSGFLHTQGLRQKSFMKNLLSFPTILYLGWYIWLIVQGFALYTGYFFIFTDIVKLILKKPIVYQWDITVQEEKILQAERRADSNRIYIVQPAGYCRKCGSPYAEQSMVCANCGAKIRNQNPNNNQV